MTGTIVTRETKDGAKRYHVVFRVGGKQKWKTFERRKAAERFLASVVKKVHDGTYVDVRPMPMGHVFDEWLRLVLEPELAAGELKPSYGKSCRSVVKVHLRPAFADVRSDQLVDAIPDWLGALAKKQGEKTMSRKTAKNIVGLLHTILSWAREDAQRYLATDPLAGYMERRKKKGRRAVVPDREVRHLEPAELRRLLEAAAHDAVALMILELAAFAGLRSGELFALQWADLDEEGARLRVRRSIFQGAITAPKTATSSRTLDLPLPIVQRLQEYRKSYPAVDARGFIFRSASGAPLDPDNWFKRVFVPIAVAAKLRPEQTEGVEDRDLVGLHTLRHTYASLLIAAGENLKYVSRQLGHSKINITVDTYGHLLKETSAAAMARLAMRIPTSRGASAVA